MLNQSQCKKNIQKGATKICKSRLCNLSNHFICSQCEQAHQHNGLQLMSLKVNQIKEMLTHFKNTAKNSTQILKTYQITFEKIKKMFQQKILQQKKIKIQCTQVATQGKKLLTTTSFPNVAETCQRIQKLSQKLKQKNYTRQQKNIRQKMEKVESILLPIQKQEIQLHQLTPIKKQKQRFLQESPRLSDSQYKLSSLLTMQSTRQNKKSSFIKQLDQSVCQKESDKYAQKIVYSWIGQWAAQTFAKQYLIDHKYSENKLMKLISQYEHNSSPMRKQPRLMMLNAIKSVIDICQTYQQYEGKDINDKTIPQPLIKHEINPHFRELGKFIMQQTKAKSAKFREYILTFSSKAYVNKYSKLQMFDYIQSITKQIVKTQEIINKSSQKVQSFSASKLALSQYFQQKTSVIINEDEQSSRLVLNSDSDSDQNDM